MWTIVPGVFTITNCLVLHAKKTKTILRPPREAHICCVHLIFFVAHQAGGNKQEV